MADLKLDLDPKKILQSMSDISAEFKKLAEVAEDSLGKNAAKSIDKLSKAAEEGATSIASRFRDLGKRIKEDLKTAFNISGVMGGLKLAESLGEGIKEVFNMEKAFDKLNTRLQLTGKTFQDFKKNIGTAIASTGQKIEDVFPGVEAAASRGYVKSPEALASIAKMLGQAKAATGEGTEALSESVVEILKSQGKKVTAESFKTTLDALQATRIQGSFHTAGEAGAAIQGISSYGQQLGLNTRQMGGLVANASGAGAAGQDILQKLIASATQIGGANIMNQVLGQNIFKAGTHGQATGMNVDALRKVDVNRFGSQQVMEQVTGLTGASGSDFKRFVSSLKEGSKDFGKVTNGLNENATQFQMATNNLASFIDKRKEKTKNASREVGEDMATAVNELLAGHGKSALDATKHGMQSMWENKDLLGTALLGGGVTAAVLGGSANALLKKMPGLGGLAGGLAEGETLKGAGIQPVYVVNHSEIGGNSMVDKFMAQTGKLAGGGAAASALTGFSLMGTLGGVAAGAGGLFAGKQLAESSVGDTIGNMFPPTMIAHAIMEALDVGGVKAAQKGYQTEKSKASAKAAIPEGDHEKLASAIGKHMEAAILRANRGKPVQLSNPSRPTGYGSKQ